MRKLLAIVITCVLLINSVSYAHCDESDIYASNFEETVVIGEERYTYQYSYGTDGDRIIVVVNDNTQEEDVVRRDVESGSITLNGELVVVEETSYYAQNVSGNTRANYVYLGSKSKTITYNESVAIGTFVALVATAIDIYMTAQGVITELGIATAEYIVEKGTKAVVSTDIYRWVAGKVTTYKYVWKIKDSGNEIHGPHTSYMGV